MSSSTATIPPAKALQLHSLITLTEQGIASRVLTKTSGGNLTLFAFDAGQGLAEHTSPFDALVLVLEGTLIDDRRDRGSREAGHHRAHAGRRGTTSSPRSLPVGRRRGQHASQIVQVDRLD